jgi:hypothetical protein
MDDRSLLHHVACPPLVRESEFSRLGKSLLACAYERLVPIVRVTLIGDRSSSPSASAVLQVQATRVIA